MKEKKIGILGGMGPLATADLFRKIIMHTGADSDRDHLRIFIDSNCKIPDRTDYIMGKGESPLPEMIKSALRLEMMGADIIVMPCNTAHYFYNDIRQYLGAEFINMIEETAAFISLNFPGSRAALLATEGTCRAGVYDRVFGGKGLALVKPDKKDQDKVSSVIYSVKKGIFIPFADGLAGVLSALRDKGADIFILGCTELPVYFDTLAIKEACVDPTDILARSAVERAGGRLV